MRRKTANLSFVSCFSIALVLLSGCESQPRELQLSSEESFDGLRLVKNTVAHRVWVREGLDLSRYDALMLEGAGIKYRMVDDARTTRGRASQTEFPITPQARERLVRSLVSRSLRSSSAPRDSVSRTAPVLVSCWWRPR